MAIQIIDVTRTPVKEPSPSTLEKLYFFRRPSEVKEFLEASPFLKPLLVEAYERIGNCFGPKPEVVLEVVTDPEADDDRQLFAFIQTSLPSEQALDKLDRLDDDWWLDAADRSEGKLCLHVEFV
jgi:hypothetical protein